MLLNNVTHELLQKNITTESEDEKNCSYCQIVETLIPKDVTHKLYQTKVLTDNQLKSLNNDKISVTERNCTLLDILHTHRKPKEVAAKFVTCLATKYAHLIAKLGLTVCGDNLPKMLYL